MTAVRRLSLLALCLAVLTSCVGIDIAAQSEIKYRAGVTFLDPDTGIIEGFCHRNTRPA